MADTYSSEVEQLKSQLSSATDISTITTIRSKLFYLSLQHWRSVNNLEELTDEINKRFIINKTANNEPVISDAVYQQWLAVLKKGNTSETLISARDLLTRSDQGFYQILVDERKKAISKGQTVPSDITPTQTSSNSTVPSESSTSIIPSSGVSTTIQNSDGTFSLVTKEEPVTVKNNQTTTPTKKTQITSNKKQQDPNYFDRRPAWIDTNVEYHRTKTVNGLKVDSAYIKRYYSVIDAEVYFGNEYVEDIHDIDWIIRQNVKPLFGYNSYTYDEVARGNRTIMGSFTINFTSPNYLFSILEEANKANVTSITNMTSYTVPKLSEPTVPTLRKGTVGSKERGHHANIWPQTFDIDIIFGEKTGAGDPVHILLLGCAIMSNRMVLSASVSGSPPVIMENYNFIAQDIRTIVAGQNDETKPISKNNDNSTVKTPNEDTDGDDTVDETTSSNFSNLSNLKVSKENKEMAEYHRKHMEEEAAQREIVKNAVNAAIAKAKAS